MEGEGESAYSGKPRDTKYETAHAQQSSCPTQPQCTFPLLLSLRAGVQYRQFTQRLQKPRQERHHVAARREQTARARSRARSCSDLAVPSCLQIVIYAREGVDKQRVIEDAQQRFNVDLSGAESQIQVRA